MPMNVHASSGCIPNGDPACLERLAFVCRAFDCRGILACIVRNAVKYTKCCKLHEML